MSRNYTPLGDFLIAVGLLVIGTLVVVAAALWGYKTGMTEATVRFCSDPHVATRWVEVCN